MVSGPALGVALGVGGAAGGGEGLPRRRGAAAVVPGARHVATEA